MNENNKQHSTIGGDGAEPSIATKTHRVNYAINQESVAINSSFAETNMQQMQDSATGTHPQPSQSSATHRAMNINSGVAGAPSQSSAT